MALGFFNSSWSARPAAAPAPRLAAGKKSYWSATRHPWPCFLFLLPLLGTYECGVLWMGGDQPESLRNGADTWLHWGLEACGLPQTYWVPALVVAFLLGWSWVRRHDRPGDLAGVCAGMAFECLGAALLLWTMSRGLDALLHRLGIVLSAPPQANPAVVRLVTYLGAGIYEEVLFRLLLFGGLVVTLRRVDLSPAATLVLATVTAALVFAAAHHLGPYGDPFNGRVFLFRVVAGLYFTFLFLYRGFGVAVGAHACYDVLVGLAAR